MSAPRKDEYPVAQPFAPPPGWPSVPPPLDSPNPFELEPASPAAANAWPTSPPPSNLYAGAIKAALFTALAFVSVFTGWLLFHGTKKTRRATNAEPAVAQTAPAETTAAPRHEEPAVSSPKEKPEPDVKTPPEEPKKKSTEKPAETGKDKPMPKEDLAVLALTFDKDVLPIFKQKCIGCHGAARKKGGVDVRTVAALLKNGKKGPALVPGSPDKSPLWETIDTNRMPPGKTKLTAAEKETVRKWIHAAPKMTQ